jgi:DDE superfamily endonuclease
MAYGLNWKRHCDILVAEGTFKRHYRMKLSSFNKLLALLLPFIKVDELQSIRSTGRGPIIPEIALHCGIRYLAGSSYLDVHDRAELSVPSFYRIIWKVFAAIESCDEIAIRIPSSPRECRILKHNFKKKSSHGLLSGCVGAMDGWLCRIKTPRPEETANVTGFFSGHYQAMGINVQAMCDDQCRFTYVGVLCPGGSNDLSAYRSSSLARRESGWYA